MTGGERVEAEMLAETLVYLLIYPVKKMYHMDGL